MRLHFSFIRLLSFFFLLFYFLCFLNVSNYCRVIRFIFFISFLFFFRLFFEITSIASVDRCWFKLEMCWPQPGLLSFCNEGQLPTGGTGCGRFLTHTQGSAYGWKTPSPPFPLGVVLARNVWRVGWYIRGCLCFCRSAEELIELLPGRFFFQLFTHPPHRPCRRTLIGSSRRFEA